MTKSNHDRGLVLVSLLLILALLGLAMGASLWVTRAELWAVGRARSESQAAYTATAGLRHGMAVLAADADWQALRELSPDALALPTVPGPWPIASGGWVSFPGPPFGYALEVLSPAGVVADPGSVVIRSTATAVRGAVVAIEATLSRAHAPYAPAALVLSGGGLVVELAAMGSPTNPLVVLGGGANVAALGAFEPPALATAVAAAEQAGIGLADGAIADVRRFDMERFARRSRLEEVGADALASLRGLSGGPLAGWTRGGRLPALRGAGVLFVDGDLDIEGEVEFAGFLAVSGRLRVGGGPCTMKGMVWARDVAFAGPCRLRFDAAALAEADAVLRLPRLPVLAAFGSG